MGDMSVMEGEQMQYGRERAHPQARQAHRRSKKKSPLVTLLLWLVLLGLLVIVLLRTVFVVREVLVVGEVSVSSEQIVRAAGIDFGSSIFRVDEQAIQKRVNALGTLAADEVLVEMPNTVILSLHERKPCAILLHMGKLRILDEEGCVISDESDAKDLSLVYVDGMRVMDCWVGEAVQAQVGQLEAYSAVMRALEKKGARSLISEINLADIRNITLVTRTGIRVELGDAQNMDNKIAWTKSAVQDLENRNEGGGVLDASSGSKADYRR